MQLDGQPCSDTTIRIPQSVLGSREDEVELLWLKVLRKSKAGQDLLLRRPLVLSLLHTRRQQFCASVTALVTPSRKTRHDELGDGKGHAFDGDDPHIPDRISTRPVSKNWNPDGAEDVPASRVLEVKGLAAGRAGDWGGIGLVGLIDLRGTVILPGRVAVLTEHVAAGKDDTLRALSVK